MTTSSVHVAAFAFPFGTHAAPLLHLVRRLADSAPSVTFSFITTSKSNASIFSGQNPADFANIKAYDVDDGLPEGYVPSRGMDEMAGSFLKAAPGNFRKGVELAEADSGKKVSGLLTDAFLWFAGEMAAEKGVPWVAFWTAGASSLSVHMYTDLIRKMCGNDKNGETNLSFIPGMSKIRLNDIPKGIISGDLDLSFAHALHNMGLMMPKANAVVINSFEELDHEITNDLKKRLQNLLSIGPSILSSPPPSKSDESGILKWLDTQNDESVVYISFGSICSPPPNELLALANALEESGTPFVWSIRDNQLCHLAEGFQERTSKTGKIVPWAPQLEILAHPSVGIFATHCGWNSVLESISFGVRMLCRPFFGDQMLNSAMVENVWKIGMKVEGGVFTKSGTLQAIQLIYSKEKGREMRENVSVLKEYAIKAVGLNGISTKNFKILNEIITSSSKQFNKIYTK